MPRFFFHVESDRETVADEEGVEFSDSVDAKIAAQREVADMAQEAMPVGDTAQFAVKVTDEAGRPVYDAGLSFRGKDLDGNRRKTSVKPDPTET